MNTSLNTIYKKIPGIFPQDEIKTVLEVGPNEGDFCNRLVEEGIVVTAIDIERSPSIDPRVFFEEMDFEMYHTNTIFDLVHARNVIPFFKDKVGQIEKMFSLGRYVYFTFFGPNDPWSDRGRTLTKDAITHLLKDVEVLYFKEEEFLGKTMKGMPKHWHIYTYLVKTKYE